MSTRAARTKKRQPIHPLKRVLGRESEDDFIFNYLKLIDTPRSLSVWMMYEYGEHDQLAGLKINPLDYCDVSSFDPDYRATKFLSKYSALQTTFDRKQVAIDSFWASERRCFETNRYLSSVRGAMQKAPALNGILHSAALRIGRILGPFPGSEYFESNGCGWGPGSTSSVKGRYVSAVYKFQGELETTPQAMDSAKSAVRYYDLWGSSALSAEGPVSVLERAFTKVRGNKLSLVPKNAKTDRVICVEPHCNVWLQKAVGAFIRRRLKYSGCNLDDQSINQKRARTGSLDSTLATIDLAAASDSISVELVRDLLPIDWFIYLDSLRSKKTLIDGKTIYLSKFSSMGNGFTFELESMIFLALAESVCEDVTVYGDDIIVDTGSAPTLIKLLDLCGFSTNPGKTFLEGPFRESCGHDCFAGTILKPYYHKNPMTLAGHWVIAHNSIRASMSRYGCMSRKVHSFLDWMSDSIPGFLGPVGYGDFHYHRNFDECTPRRAGNQLEGYVLTTWLTKPIRTNGAHAPYSKICASLAPKGPRSVDASTLFRGRYLAVQGRILCAKWPEDILIFN